MLLFLERANTVEFMVSKTKITDERSKTFLTVDTMLDLCHAVVFLVACVCIGYFSTLKALSLPIKSLDSLKKDYALKSAVYSSISSFERACSARVLYVILYFLLESMHYVLQHVLTLRTIVLTLPVKKKKCI